MERDDDELALAAACAAGEPVALARLERDYLPELHATLVRMGLPQADVEETARVVRDELLAARAPRLREFTGRGSLRGWLRAVAARAGVRVKRPSAGSITVELAATAAAGASDAAADADAAAELPQHYDEAFREAFAAAVAQLPAAERLLLKQRHRHRLGIAELARLHGIDEPAVERRLDDARERLAAATRADMVGRLGALPADDASLGRQIRSRLDISLSALTPTPA